MNTPDFPANTPVTLSGFYGAPNVPRDPNALNDRELTIDTAALEDQGVASSVQVAFEAGGLSLNGEGVDVVLPEGEDTAQVSHSHTFGWLPGEPDLAEARVKLNEAQLATEQQSQ